MGVLSQDEVVRRRLSVTSLSRFRQGLSSSKVIRESCSKSRDEVVEADHTVDLIGSPFYDVTTWLEAIVLEETIRAESGSRNWYH